MCLKEFCCLRKPIVDGDGLKHTQSRREDNRDEARSKPKLPKTTNMPNREFRDSNGKFTSYTPPKEESPRRTPRYFAEEGSSVSPYPQPQHPKKEVHSRIHGNVSDDGFPSEFETADIVDNRMQKNKNRGTVSYSHPQTTTKNEVRSRIQDNVSDDGFPLRFETADTVENQMLKKVGRTDVDSQGHGKAKSQAKTNDSYAGSVESMQAKSELKYPYRS